MCGQQRCHLLSLVHADRAHDALFGEVRTQGVHQFRAPANRQLAPSKDRSAGLLFLGFRGNETQLRLAGRNSDRLCIRRIIFLSLCKGMDILRRNEFGLVTKN